MPTSTIVKKNGKRVAPQDGNRPDGNMISLPRVNIDLYGGAAGAEKAESLVRVLKLALAGSDDIDEAAVSAQSADVGEKQHPFNMRDVGRFMVANTHHSACILAKRDATTGLGFASEKVSELLDELTSSNFLDLMNVIGEDYWQCGNGYMEVVRVNGVIAGLHHIPAAQVTVYLEDSRTYDYHYIIRASEGAERRFSRFGDKVDFLRRNNGIKEDTVSEVIHFRQPSALSRWYGVPNWLAAVPCIELVMAILQHNYDFFNNRGVPEFILFLLGGKVADPDFKTITDGLKRNIGLGNGHKSMVVNLSDPNVKVDLQKLNVEGGNTEAAFEAFLDTLSLKIVSAHRVPPLLAGIQIPGKLGANNELPNAMAGFQALVINPTQMTFAHQLGTTLGHPKLGVRQGLRGHKAFQMKTILETINVDALATASSTRTPVGASAEARGEKKKPAPKKSPAKAVVAKITKRFKRVEAAVKQLRARSA